MSGTEFFSKSRPRPADTSGRRYAYPYKSTGEKQHEELWAQLQADVHAAWKEAQKYGTMTEGPWLDPATMFDDVYAEIPQHLESQRRRMLEVLRGE